MDTEDKLECTALLSLNEDEQEKLPDNSEKENASETSDTISLKAAFVLIVSATYGTAVTILPFTVCQLGVLPWTVSMITFVSLISLCGYLISQFVQDLMQDEDIVRDPYPAIAEKGGGMILRKVLTTTMYINNTAISISCILLSSTIIVNLAPSANVSHVNSVRMWSAFIICIVTPIMYFGAYSELKMPATIAVIASLVAQVAIITNCFLSKFRYGIKPEILIVKHVPKQEIFFIPLATLLFTCAGVSMTIANITSVAARPKKLIIPISVAYVVMCIIYTICGLVPYYTLGKNNLPSVTSTFHEIMKIKQTGLEYHALTITAEVCIAIHLLIIIVLFLYPCYLHMEEVFDIPHEMNWKRIAVRTAFMVIILGICCAVPKFDIIMSLTGGITSSLIAIIIPLILCVSFFDLEIYQKLCVYFLLLVAIAFAVGTFVSSIMKLLSGDVKQIVAPVAPR